MSEAATVSGPRTIPSGLLMPLSVKEIDKGKMVDRLQRAFDQVTEAVAKFRTETGNSKVKGKIMLVIEVSPTTDMESHTNIGYSISRKSPERRHQTYYRAQDSGRLLTEATKEAISARSDEEEIPLFTFLGEQKGLVDPKTMAMVGARDVAGTISPPAS